MAYKRTQWLNENDSGFEAGVSPAIDAENLNNIEDGIEEALNTGGTGIAYVTTGTNPTYEVTIPRIESIEEGMQIRVKFHENVYGKSIVYLDVNKLGAKSILNWSIGSKFVFPEEVGYNIVAMQPVVLEFREDSWAICDKLASHYIVQGEEPIPINAGGTGAFTVETAQEKLGFTYVTTTGSGSEYKATIAGITELKVGTVARIIPHTTSTSAFATLNVNGLGEKEFKRYGSNRTDVTQNLYMGAGAITKGIPLELVYSGTDWLVTSMTAPFAEDLFGTTDIANGGTGASSAEEARANLGVAPAYQYSTTDLTAGTSPLETGQLYLVYE